MLLQTYATILEALADRNYESFEESGVGDYAAKRKEFRLDAKEQFKVYRHDLCELIMACGCGKEDVGFVMNFPGPFTGARYADDATTDRIVQPGSPVGALDRVERQQPAPDGRRARRGVYRKLPGPGEG
jgi:hypothetical protein